MKAPNVFIDGNPVQKFSKCLQEISVSAGGFSRFTIELTEDDGYTETQLVGFYKSWLMKQLKARYGGFTSDWLVYELMLIQNGFPSTLSMWDVYNRVNVFWRSPHKDTRETGWIDHTQSQAKYGVIEATNTPRGIFVGERAEKYALGLLGNHAFPDDEFGLFRPALTENGVQATDQVTSLEVVAIGRAQHANRQYIEIPPPPDDDDEDPVEKNVSVYVKEIIDSSPWLKVGHIEPTDATIILQEDNVTRKWVPLWEHLRELAARASNDFHQWTVAAYQDGRVFFGPAPTAPRFEWRDRPYTWGGGDISWNSLPGICRDHRSVAKGKQAGSWKQSASDVWVDTVVCDMTKDFGELTYAPFDEDHMSASIWGDLYGT